MTSQWLSKIAQVLVRVQSLYFILSKDHKTYCMLQVVEELKINGFNLPFNIAFLQ